MKRLVLLFLIMLIITGCHSDPEAEEEKERIYPVDVIQVTEGTLEQPITLTGTVVPSKQSPVFSLLSGEVTKVHVKNGDLVQKGDLLVELKADEISLNVEQAEAALKAATAQLESAQAMRKQAISQAEQQLAQAKEAYRRLKETDPTPLELDWEEADSDWQQEVSEALRPLLELNQSQREMELTQAEMAVKSAELALKQAKGTEQIKAAEAAVEQAKTGLKMAQEQQRLTRVTAPISGQVTDLSAYEGQLASPQVPLMNIVDLDQLFLQTSVSEAQLRWLQPGQEVEIRVNALDHRGKGMIDYISPVPAQQGRAYPVEISWEEMPSDIVPGLIAQIEVDLDVDEPQVIIPIDAVLHQNGTKYVYVVSDGVAREREITTGEGTGDLISVESGLEPGEKIIVQGQFSLYDGAPVEIREERSADEID